MVGSKNERDIAIRMNPEFIARVDKLANLVRVSRHQLMKNMIEVGVEELELLSCVGVLQLGILIRDLMNGASAGKPKDPIIGNKPIPVALDTTYVARLDKLADKAGLPRHQLMKNLLRVGVEEAESMVRIGVLQFVILMRDLPGAFREVCKAGERALIKGVGHES